MPPDECAEAAWFARAIFSSSKGFSTHNPTSRGRVPKSAFPSSKNRGCRTAAFQDKAVRPQVAFSRLCCDRSRNRASRPNPRWSRLSLRITFAFSLPLSPRWPPKICWRRRLASKRSVPPGDWAANQASERREFAWKRKRLLTGWHGSDESAFALRFSGTSAVPDSLCFVGQRRCPRVAAFPALRAERSFAGSCALASRD